MDDGDGARNGVFNPPDDERVVIRSVDGGSLVAATAVVADDGSTSLNAPDNRPRIGRGGNTSDEPVPIADDVLENKNDAVVVLLVGGPPELLVVVVVVLVCEILVVTVERSGSGNTRNGEPMDAAGRMGDMIDDDNDVFRLMLLLLPLDDDADGVSPVATPSAAPMARKPAGLADQNPAWGYDDENERNGVLVADDDDEDDGAEPSLVTDADDAADTTIGVAAAADGAADDDMDAVALVVVDGT